jgi:hypothetical protein
VGSGPLFGLLPNGMDVTSNPLLLERQTTAPRIGRIGEHELRLGAL